MAKPDYYELDLQLERCRLGTLRAGHCDSAGLGLRLDHGLGVRPNNGQGCQVAGTVGGHLPPRDRSSKSGRRCCAKNWNKARPVGLTWYDLWAQQFCLEVVRIDARDMSGWIPTAGKWWIVTDTSSYLLDLNNQTGIRFPGDGVGDTDSPVARLRQDGLPFIIHNLQILEVGKPMLMGITVEHDVYTTRMTTNVRRIEEEASVLPYSGMS